MDPCEQIVVVQIVKIHAECITGIDHESKVTKTFDTGVEVFDSLRIGTFAVRQHRRLHSPIQCVLIQAASAGDLLACIRAFTVTANLQKRILFVHYAHACSTKVGRT